MITPSIIRALLEDNFVIITGLGTFSVKKFPSQIKEDIVYPPKNIVEFEYSKDIEGFDFVSKLSKWEQIRTDEAQIRVSEWLKLLEEGLEHNKSLFFEDFGTFSKEPSGKIVFQCILIPQLNIETEGFEPVYIQTIDKKQEFQKTVEPIKDKRDILVKKSKKRDKMWFVLTISAAVFLLFVLFFKEKISHFYQTVFAKSETVVIIEDEEDTDTMAYINKVEKMDTTVDHKKETNPVSSSNNIYLPYEKGKYYVIAGSFTKDEDALRHIKEKKLEKYHAKIIVESQNPRKRVCIGVFDNEEDAVRFAAQTDKNYWVLK